MTGQLAANDGTTYLFAKEINTLHMVRFLENLICILRLTGRWERVGEGERYILDRLAAIKEGRTLPQTRDRAPAWHVTCPRRHVLFACEVLAQRIDDVGSFEHPDRDDWAMWHIQAAVNALATFGPFSCRHVLEAVFQDMITMTV